MGTTMHDGWPEATRYVKIQLEMNCTGAPTGPFSIAEWDVYGYYQTGMARKYESTWPHCENLWSDVDVEEDPQASCFSYTELEDVKKKCLSSVECDGFSFQAGSINGGHGGGCF